jgi:hypothetical protein
VGQRHALPGALRRSPRAAHRQGMVIRPLLLQYTKAASTAICCFALHHRRLNRFDSNVFWLLSLCLDDWTV